jgi:cob(I)alamin adenosyltransferase
MRLTKIYTKIGDGGKTQLATGEQVPKSDLRIHAYGTVDELNSTVGMVRDHLIALKRPEMSDLTDKLRVIQNELFDIGGELSVTPQHLNTAKQQVVSFTDIQRLETEIDRFNENLSPLKNFVLPGGHISNSTAHLARTVCRRAERYIVELSVSSKERPEVQIYLNRLSDWLFVLSREICRRLELDEVLWNQKGR